VEAQTDPDAKKMWRSAGSFAAVGLEMGFALVLGMLGGWYLDGKLETEPLFFWIGFGLGLAAAAKAVYDGARRARKAMGNNESSNSDKD